MPHTPVQTTPYLTHRTAWAPVPSRLRRLGQGADPARQQAPVPVPGTGSQGGTYHSTFLPQDEPAAPHDVVASRSIWLRTSAARSSSLSSLGASLPKAMLASLSERHSQRCAGRNSGKRMSFKMTCQSASGKSAEGTATGGATTGLCRAGAAFAAAGRFRAAAGRFKAGGMPARRPAGERAAALLALV